MRFCPLKCLARTCRIAIGKASAAVWNGDTPELVGSQRPDVGALFELSPEDDAQPFLKVLKGVEQFFNQFAITFLAFWLLSRCDALACMQCRCWIILK